MMANYIFIHKNIKGSWNLFSLHITLKSLCVLFKTKVKFPSQNNVIRSIDNRLNSNIYSMKRKPHFLKSHILAKNLQFSRCNIYLSKL